MRRLKRILKYRIVWEDGVNPNYVGPKAVSCETPDYLHAIVAYQDNRKPFGSQRFECVVEDTETGQIETKILYREIRKGVEGEIRYRFVDLISGSGEDEIAEVYDIRDKAFDHIWEFIEENNDDYDQVKGERIPQIMAFNYIKEVKKYVVEDRNSDRSEDFYTIEEVLEFLGDKPFGFEISRLDGHGYSSDPIYIEEDSESNPEFYVVNTYTEKEFEDGFDAYDNCPNFEYVDIYGAYPVYFKDLQELRRYTLTKIDSGKADKCDNYFVRGECFSTIESLEREEVKDE